LPGIWEEWFQSAGVVASKQKARLQVQSTAQVLDAIRSDERIGLIDHHLVRPDIEAGRIALACRHTYTEGDAYFLVLPQDADRSTALDCFRRWLRDQAADGHSATD
jgi:LysR family glycine cleavage system transcriptional activator